MIILIILVGCASEVDRVPVSEIEGFAVINSNWSDKQGRMDWESGNSKCKNIGMRLPTIEELKTAYNAKVTDSWDETSFMKGGYSFWASKGSSETNAYTLHTGLGYIANAPKYAIALVRCIREQ